MKLIYKGKYNGNPESLPSAGHREGAVKFKEPSDMKKLSIAANIIAFFVACILLAGLLVRGDGLKSYSVLGFVVSFLTLFPHEILHAICFKGDVYLYTNFKQGLLFVCGTEDMSKARFIFMSMLPNIVFGIIPYVIFLIFPNMSFLGTMGAFATSMGGGDYINVFNALTQMPKGSRTYIDKMSSYWYMP